MKRLLLILILTFSFQQLSISDETSIFITKKKQSNYITKKKQSSYITKKKPNNFITKKKRSFYITKKIKNKKDYKFLLLIPFGFAIF